MRSAIRFICMLLVSAMLTIPAGAAGFTPSVEQKGSPVPNQKNVTVTALVDLDKAPVEVKKVVEEAHKVIVEAKSLVDAVPAVEIALKAMQDEAKADAKNGAKADMLANIKAENLVVRDLFHVSLDKKLAPGKEQVVIFKTEGIEKNDFLMVMVFVDGEWVVLDADKVKITADGKVQVRFSVVGPVAFVTEKK